MKNAYNNLKVKMAPFISASINKWDLYQTVQNSSMVKLWQRLIVLYWLGKL